MALDEAGHLGPRLVDPDEPARVDRLGETTKGPTLPEKARRLPWAGSQTTSPTERLAWQCRPRPADEGEDAYELPDRERPGEVDAIIAAHIALVIVIEWPLLVENNADDVVAVWLFPSWLWSTRRSGCSRGGVDRITAWARCCSWGARSGC